MGKPFTSRHSSSDQMTLVTILPRVLLPYTGCPITFNLLTSGTGINAWADHSAKEHLAMHFPITTGCCFCAKLYEVAPGSGQGAEVYRRRMRQIARHFLNDETLPEDRRPDSSLLRHHHDPGILHSGEGHAQDIGSRLPAVVPDRNGPITINTITVKKLRLQDVHVEVAGRRRRRARSSVEYKHGGLKIISSAKLT